MDPERIYKGSRKGNTALLKTLTNHKALKGCIRGGGEEVTLSNQPESMTPENNEINRCYLQS